MKFLFSVSSYYVTLKTSQTEIRKRAVLSDDSWHPAICHMAYAIGHIPHATCHMQYAYKYVTFTTSHT